jgi:hypothetical protein
MQLKRTLVPLGCTFTCAEVASVSRQEVTFTPQGPQVNLSVSLQHFRSGLHCERNHSTAIGQDVLDCTTLRSTIYFFGGVGADLSLNPLTPEWKASLRES